ncbi:MAG TPA: BTAD domain-containing putative transcriptional regulator, partial [Streptosporangiaceae bacterium]|nr:BTAD domain-containing putative transcriptional regulator [Streptosporangiaceae bacterium]
MDFAILGPLRVSERGVPLEVPGAKERTLLACLVARAGQAVPATFLIDALWGDAPPASAAKSLQTFVLRLRNVLEPERGGVPRLLVTVGSGYRLAAGASDVDAARFEVLTERARVALTDRRPDAAFAIAREALAMWRGPAYADFRGIAFADSEARRLEELRHAAVELQWAAAIDSGRASLAVAQLERLVSEHPLRESFWQLLLLALYRSGRPGDALAAYERVRLVLAAELGADPGPDLRRLHSQILRQDEALAPPRLRINLPTQLTPSLGPFVGRHAEVAVLRDAWGRAAGGEAVGIVVRGPSGAGATRLAAEIARDVAHAGGAVAFAGPGRHEHLEGTGLLVVRGSTAQPPRPGQLVILLAADGTPVPPGFVVLDLRPLGVDDVRELVADYVEPVRLSELTSRVLADSAGWPGRVHDAARRLSREVALQRAGLAAARAEESHTLLAAARGDVAAAVTAAQDAAGVGVDPLTCPWRALDAYEREDAPWFCGRERLVAELVARTASTRLVCVVGASGSGKSSIVRAGLLAALAEGVLPGSAAWTQLVMRPGEHPMQFLAEVALGGHAADLGELLVRLVQAPVGGDTDRVVLVIDQLEELWTQCTDAGERASFLDTIAGLDRGSDSRLSVVLVLRSDYVADLADHGELAAELADGTVLVGALSPDEIRRVVEKPARRGGLTLDDGLADAIVADAGREPGLLPLLSSALTQLWELRSGQRLTIGQYVAMDGIQGAIAHLAESAYGSLSEHDQELTRLIAYRLAGPGVGSAVVRRRVPLPELESMPVAGARSVVERLAAARLLTLADGSVEVAHEALFRDWPRLRTWLQDDASGREVQRRLVLAAAEWAADERDAGALWQGSRLEAALDVAERRPDELTPIERSFLDASRDRVTAERDAAQQQAATARRQNRRLRRLLGGLGALLVVALVAGTLAVAARTQAERDRRTAEARQLAAASLVQDQPDLALLTALEGVRAQADTQTYGALLTLLARNPNVMSRVRTPDRFLRGASSPDGKTVYLSENTGRIQAVDALTGQRRWAVEVPNADIGVWNIFASPDGRSLLVTGHNGAPHVLILDAGSGRTRLALGPQQILATGAASDAIANGAGWLPDGRAVFASATDLFVMRADGSGLHALAWPTPGVHPDIVRVWPDGRISLATGAGPDQAV